MSSPPEATLVLGGTGFLGAHVVAEAVRRAQALATMADPLGPPVVAVGRQIDAAPRFSSPRDAADWLAADLAEEGRAVQLLEEEQPRLVVLCAALSRVGTCAEDPDLASRLNVELPRTVALWCHENERRLVHVSTDLVFGAEPPPRATGFREEDTPAPVSVYGRTKAEGEQAVLEASSSALVVRLPLLFGNSGGRGQGASDSLLEAVDRDLAPQLFTDELRTPLEVSNAAEALLELGEGTESGLLHVAGPRALSRFDLGVTVLEAMGLSPEDARGSIRATTRSAAPELGERPGDTSLDSARARGLLECDLLDAAAGMERALR